MRNTTLAAAYNTAGDSNTSPVSFQNVTQKTFVLFQCDISATGTVVLQGRLTPAMSYIDIVTMTSSGAETVAAYPDYRLKITGNTGTINAAIAE